MLSNAIFMNFFCYFVNMSHHSYVKFFILDRVSKVFVQALAGDSCPIEIPYLVSPLVPIIN